MVRFSFKVFFWLLATQSSLGLVPSYQCKHGINKNWCALWNVAQTSPNKHFKVIPHLDASVVDGVYFEDSKMEIFTQDVCDALPFITYVWTSNQGLTSVDDNAFRKCTKLKEVTLRGNSLINLPPGLFDSNVDLTEVWLNDNKLTKIDANLFKNNPNLEIISLEYNELQEFSFSPETPVLKQLREISLRHNKLRDVDAETLVEKCPNLKHFWIDANLLSCDRQREIITTLLANEIKFSTGHCTKTLTKTQFLTAKGTKSPTTTTMKAVQITGKIDPTLDIREIVTDLQNKHSTSNLINIIIGSILTLMILCGIFVYGVKKFLNQRNAQPVVEEIDLTNRNGAQNVASWPSLGTNGDYYYGSRVCWGSGYDQVNHYQVPVGSSQEQQRQKRDFYDRLNFNRVLRRH